MGLIILHIVIALLLVGVFARLGYLCESLFGSCTSLPINKSRNLLRVEWAPVYHVKAWGKFIRNYEDFWSDVNNLSKRHLCRPRTCRPCRGPGADFSREGRFACAEGEVCLAIRRQASLVMCRPACY
jgi:hypothetical protein